MRTFGGKEPNQGNFAANDPRITGGIASAGNLRCVDRAIRTLA